MEVLPAHAAKHGAHGQEAAAEAAAAASTIWHVGCVVLPPAAADVARLDVSPEAPFSPKWGLSAYFRPQSWYSSLYAWSPRVPAVTDS